MRTRLKFTLFIIPAIFFFGIGCKSLATVYKADSPFEKISTHSIDYSLPENWAVMPSKYPQILSTYKVQNSQDSIDVFYVYPTLYLSNKDTFWNAPLEDTIQKNKVINLAVKYQASAWASSGNLYIPYYRQAHIRSYFNLENGGNEALAFAYEDVKVSFEYYLKHYNKGHGIILAGHSQGSGHLASILKDYFDGKPLQNQLVAAYLPGNIIEKTQFKTIKLMESPNEIGGFVTWNTLKKNTNKKFVKLGAGKAVINPVTWEKTEMAKRELHKGILYTDGKIYQKNFDTYLDDGFIWITLPNVPKRYVSLFMKHYHDADINLFWEDIRQNSLRRVQNFRAIKK